MTFAPIDPLIYREVIARALQEDLGPAGDVTTAAVVPAGARLEARIVAREAGRLAGLPIALEVFRQLDPAIAADIVCTDGADIEAGETLAVLIGPARPILTGERTALNILTRLSGIATATRRAVAAVRPHATRVACTRKTTPGLRALEKYAVRAGGGVNHRFGLFDAVLIKDNHIAAAGGLGPAIARARAAVGHTMTIEAEVDSLAQLAEALAAGVDAVLLDNMAPAQVREAVAIVAGRAVAGRAVAGRAVVEASGGIRPDTVQDYAAAGADVVSLGWLTHSAAGLDIGLDCVAI